MGLHRIRRQRMLVKAVSRDAAFAWRRDLTARSDTEIIPTIERAIERALAKHPIGNRVVHIDRLEVRLHAADVNALLEGLGAEVERVVASAVRSAGTSGARDDVAADGSGTAESYDWSAALATYLETGMLPWHSPVEDRAAVIESLRVAAASLARTGDWLRLPTLGSLDALYAWARRLLAFLNQAERESLRAQIAAMPAIAAVSAAEATISEARVPIAAMLVRELLRESEPGARFESEALEVLAWIVALSRSDSQVSAHSSNSLLTLIARIARPDVKALLEKPASRDIRPPASTHKNGESHVVLSGAEPLPKCAEPLTDIDGVTVLDAGLILLHPFLPRLFDAVGLVPGADRRFATGALSRAAALLHWIAHGRTERFEFECGTAKLLLGLSPNDLVDVTAGELPASDRTEADALLAAAIGHWSVLRSTTIDGLRSSFLMRRGLLRRAVDGDTLHVESAPFDLLLGQLPWSISVVALPWMPKPLYVEWPTP